SPSAFNPQTGYLYVAGSAQNGGFTRYPEGDEELVFQEGLRYWGSAFNGAIIGSRMRGTFTAMDTRTNTIAWQVQKDYALRADGALATAGGLVFTGMPDGNLEAYD